MKNILRVFLLDAKRLSTNVVALVIVMGLSIIPALYAWFNILSNWDPYGPSATSQMQIAVFSEDTGVTIGKVSVSIGDKVVENLESNDTIGWVFPETKDAALAGVYSGEYYAALVMPEEFTMDMISFLSGNPEHPQLEYYENSKKNAIATKITGKVKNTVQQSVNTAFVSAIAEVFSKTSSVISGDADAEDKDLVTMLIDEMKIIDEDLDTAVGIMDGCILITDSTGNIVKTSKNMLPDLEKIIDSSVVGISGMEGTVTAGAQAASTTMTALNITLDLAEQKLKTLQKTLEQLPDLIPDLGGKGPDITPMVESIQKAMDAIITVLEVTNPGDPNLASLKEHYGNFNDHVDQLKKDQDASNAKLENLAKEVNVEIEGMYNDIASLRRGFNNITPEINDSVSKVQGALQEAQRTLLKMDDNFIDASMALQSYGDTLDNAQASFTESRGYVLELQEKLEEIIDGLEELVNDEAYREIADALSADPELIAEYVTSPVVMDTQIMYEIEGYGSAMAPFYTTLALWVGALIMVALIKVKVKRHGLEDVREHEAFYGRFITFYLISQAQALITVLGDLLFVGIQCVHPVKFWFAASVISFTFMMIMYSLTVAFGNVGQAIAVVIMVIQVAGAGCTFPIEVLPAAYQAVYKLLPFVYSMNALKACVGGIYRSEYWYNLGILAIFALVFMLIGVFLKKPFAKLNEMIEHSKEKSGVMM